MTILEQLAALPEISPAAIREKFTFEQLFTELQIAIYEKQDNPDYDALLDLFNEVDELLGDNRYNIFNERLFLKGAFMSRGYGIDFDLINAILASAPLILVEMKLTELLKDNNLFNYMENLYKEFKSNQILNMDRILETLDELELPGMVEELTKEVDSLKELAQ